MLVDPRRLPVTLAPMSGEALDCYLERVADSNYLTTAGLLRLVGSGGSQRFLAIAPSTEIVSDLAGLTGCTEGAIAAATLASLDGRGIDLHGINPQDQHSYRHIAARGWAAIHGSQVCPQCLASTGVWQLRWRTPYAAICVEHGTYLLARCPECRRPFRDQRHSPLRAVGASLECGNPLGAGPRKHCRTNLAQLTTAPAPQAEVRTQRRIDAALDGSGAEVLGAEQSAEEYLRELRALAVLLLHLAAQRTDQTEAVWLSAVQAAAADRTGDRGPRWGLRPPDDPIARAGAFATADTVLAAPDNETAAVVFTPWLDRVPRVPEGTLGWLADRTQMTETLSNLVVHAHAPHRRLSHLLDTTGPLLSARFVPQVIPEQIYRRHLTGLFDSTPDTVRLFAAICLARTNNVATSWAGAGELLALPAGLAERTARACSASALVRPQRIIEAVTNATQDLSRFDHRAVEASVAGLRRRRTWFDTFAAERPGTRSTSKGYAITWIWLNVAEAHLASSPGWPSPPTRQRRALYRQFAQSLTARNERCLKATIDIHKPGTSNHAVST